MFPALRQSSHRLLILTEGLRLAVILGLQRAGIGLGEPAYELCLAVRGTEADILTPPSHRVLLSPARAWKRDERQGK